MFLSHSLICHGVISTTTDQKENGTELPNQPLTTLSYALTSESVENVAEDRRIEKMDSTLVMKTSNDDITLHQDPFCDPENPKCIQFQDVSAAAYKVRGCIQKTPCTKSQMSNSLGMKIYFKKEFLQYTGSFKERGARYTLMMLNREQAQKGVVAASAGNHALALSYHGQHLDIPVTVVMPIVAPIMKVQACKTYGATVIVTGAHIGESKEFALKLAHKQDKLYINGYDHPHVLAGQGTMGLEIVEQVPDLDACIIPVGGGGLIAGAALAIKSLHPHVKIIGVESERCPSFGNAMEAGCPTYTATSPTLADGQVLLLTIGNAGAGLTVKPMGYAQLCFLRSLIFYLHNPGLAVPVVGVNAFATARSLIDKMVTVKEEYIALSILRLVELEKAVVEGAGATGLAAILQGLLPELEGKKVVIALCGGNIDTTALGRVIERGLAADGRLVRFTVVVSDRPGSIADLARLISNLGVSIKDIFHERAWLKSDVFSVQVKCVVETRDADHANELEQALRDTYTQLLWGPNAL